MMSVVRRIGRYEIVEELGRGAMGVVYLGRDPVIDRKLAIKTIRLVGLLDFEKSEEYLARFYLEAKAAGKLSHPGIVTVYDVGQDEETEMHYIVMEYVAGPNLKQLMTEFKFHFTEELVTTIGIRVAEALSYAHRHHVIHRDIKPANIILAANDAIKITDFGIAKLPQNELTMDGQFVGTPSYMSPEQIQGKSVDNRSDIFSLGIVLYELLAGHKPFIGEDLATVSHKITYEPHVPLSELRPELPEELSYTIDKALSKNPKDRFQSADDMMSEFQKLVNGTNGKQAYRGDPALEDTQEGTPASGEDKRPSRSITAGYSNLKQKIRKHPVLYFLALPIFMKWVLLLLAVLLIVISAPITLLALKAKKENQVPDYSNAWNRVSYQKQLLAKSEKALNEGYPAVAAENLRKLLVEVPLSPYPLQLYREALEQIKSGVDPSIIQDREAGMEDTQFQDTEGADTPQEAVVEPEPEPRPVPEPVQKPAVDKPKPISSTTSQIQKAIGLYDAGKYSDAKTIFQDILKREPKNGTAKSYLNKIEIKESLRTPKPQQVTKKPTTKVVRGRASTITFSYDSPIPEGVLTINADGVEVYKKEFSFITKSGFMKMKKEFTGGSLEGSFTLKPGPHKVNIKVVGGKKNEVNTYKPLDLNVDPKLDYSWVIILYPEVNQISLEEKKIPYASD